MMEWITAGLGVRVQYFHPRMIVDFTVADFFRINAIHVRFCTENCFELTNIYDCVEMSTL